MVLKGRVKRRLETGETDYLLQNQKIKVCEMHHTREDAETVAATGAKDPDTGTTKHIGAAPAESLEIPADAPAAGGKDSDTGKTEHIGAAPAKSLEIQANTYTREVAQWLTSLTSKASERGVFLPTILIEMCPLTTETRQKILDLVPWLPSAGYTTMLRREVKSKAKGALHVSSIHFGSKGFHGGGCMPQTRLCGSSSLTGIRAWSAWGVWMWDQCWPLAAHFFLAPTNTACRRLALEPTAPW